MSKQRNAQDHHVG